VLTGSTGKLGQNLVKGFIENNYSLILISRNANKTLDLFKDYKEHITVIQADLSSRGDIKRACDLIKKNKRNIFGLVNNAAVDIDQNMLDVSSDDFQYLLNVNLYAPYYLCKYLIPLFIENEEGVIVNVSSNLSMRSTANATEYTISKAGLDSLTRSIAVQYGPLGLRANSINISGMRGFTLKVNEILSSRNPKDVAYDDWKISQDKIPLRRRGAFSEFVDTIIFLCSDKASYINGVNLPVDGGSLSQI